MEVKYICYLQAVLGLAVVAGLVAVVVRCGYCLVFSLTRITCCLCGDKVTSI